MFCVANYTKWPQPPFSSRVVNKGKDHKGNRNMVRIISADAALDRLKNDASSSICPPLSRLNFPLSNRPYYALRRSSSLMRPTVGGSARLPSAAALGLFGIGPSKVNTFIPKQKAEPHCRYKIQQQESDLVRCEFSSLCDAAKKLPQNYVNLAK